MLRLHVAGHASPAGYCQFKQSSGSHTRLVGFPHVIARANRFVDVHRQACCAEKGLLFSNQMTTGEPRLPGGRLTPYGTTGVMEKNFRKNFQNFRKIGESGGGGRWRNLAAPAILWARPRRRAAPTSRASSGSGLFTLVALLLVGRRQPFSQLMML